MNAAPCADRRSNRAWINMLAVLAILALALPVTSAVRADAASPFVGNWRATDNVDGSDMRLTIAGRPSGPFQITWTETYLSFCSGEAGIVRGTGWLDPDNSYLLQSDLRIECLASGQSLDFSRTWQYHPTTGSLSTLDGNGMVTIWRRPDQAIQAPPPLYLRVHYGADWVESFYEAGHTAWITVTEADGSTVKATAELVTEAKDYWGGQTGFQSNDSTWLDATGSPMASGPEIEPNDWVFGWVDDGAAAQVQVGEITGQIDLGADSIQGTILAPWISVEVGVRCLPWGAPAPQPARKTDSILPDGLDSYACSWQGEWDIQPGQDVTVAYFDPADQWVGNSFSTVNPTFIAYIPAAIEGYDWPLGSLITIDINNGAYVAQATAEQREGSPPGTTRVLFHLPRDAWMQAGDHILMTDGITTKDTVVTTLAVTNIDIPGKTVSGIYDPQLSLWVWLYGEDGQVPVTDGNTWVASFSELPLGAWGGATQWELDGDGTSLDFQIPRPYILALPADDSVAGYGWPEGSIVQMSINGGADLVQSAQVMAVPWSATDIRASFDFPLLYDLKPGDVLALSGSGMEVTYIVRDISITNVDEVANSVTGTAEPGAALTASLFDFGGSEIQLTAYNGTWLADFGSIGFDLVEGMCGRAEIMDEYGDSTAADWCIP